MKDIGEHPDVLIRTEVDAVLGEVAPLVAAAMKPAIAQLSAFAKLAPGWDTYNADMISPVAIRAAIEVLVEIAKIEASSCSDELVPYHVAPLSDGGVQLEWEGPSKSLEIECGTRGEIGSLLVKRSESGREHEQREDLSITDVTALVAEVMVQPAN